jgi:hypothetical protein
MSIAVINIRKEPHYRRAAIESGLNRLGYITHDGLSRLVPKDPFDLLVLWNKKAGAEERAADEWERAGGTVIVMENGYLQKTDKTTYAISTHGHNGSGWFPVGDEDRFSKLGFEIKPWHYLSPNSETGDRVLVCAQRGIGSTLMASPPQWAEKFAKGLQQSGRCFVKIRQHPGNFAPKVPLIEDLRGMKTVAIWSSGAGVRALVEGVPVLHAAPHWICEKWGLQDRFPALNRMAHGQWSVEEITSGEPFARMRDAQWGPRTWR